MKMVETLEVRGHKNIKATHPTTFEFTKDSHLTLRGNCIIGVNATKTASQLSSEFKIAAKKIQTIIHVKMNVNGIIDEAVGKGHPSLSFMNSNSLVVRKSTYPCNRTLMILSNKGANNLSRHLVELMKNPQAKMEVTLIASVTRKIDTQ
jgi:hypothetical protein